MSQENVRIVTAAVENWGRKGPEAALLGATPDCQIDLSRARGPYAGVYDIDQATSLHESFLDHWGTRDLTLGEPIDAGDSVVIPFTDRFLGRQGVAVEATGVWVGTVRDGQLASLTLFQDLAEALQAAGVSASGRTMSEESKAIDPVGFREAQNRQWDSAAVGWKDWSEFGERAYGHISERLVELAGVQPGSRVLDIAAGYGEPALTAARKAGPQGSVVATDLSAEMLAFGRERAATANLGNVEFMESDASRLDFPAASFDAAVSRWGIIFEPDAEAAAGRIRRFLKPGARMAISSWGEPDQVPLLSIPMRTTMTRLNVPPPPPGTPGPLSRPTPAAIAALLEDGGFSNVTVEQGEVTFEFDSAEQFTAYVRAIAAPIRSMIEQHAGEAQEEAWDAITQAAAAAAAGAAVPSFSNVVLLASGTA